MKRESAIAGVVLNYLPTATNYALAIAYIVVLTRYIPLTQYGYYNALFAIVNAIGSLIPIPGISGAIAREGAIEYIRGGNIRPYFAALVFMSLIMAIIYAAVLVIAIPIYLINGIPHWLLGTVYIYLGTVVAQSLAGALGLYLWLMGRVVTQGAGSTVNMLLMRFLEVLLIVVMRNVYAIAISTLIGSVAQLLYYLGNIKDLVSPILGIGIITSRVKYILEFGFQSWILGYMGILSFSLFTYLVYRYLGPDATGIYGLAAAMVNAVIALGPAVSTVLNSRVSHGLGLGINVRSIFRDFAIPTFIASAIMVQLIVLALPILPRLSIINGDYVRSIPYASALFASAPFAVAVTVYTSYYWVIGKGWYALVANLIGLGIGLAMYVLLHILGLYMAVASNYVMYIVILTFFWVLEKWNIMNSTVSIIGLSTFLTLISSWTLPLNDPPITWPAMQLITITITIISLYIVKPLPKSLLDQLPRFARPLLIPFTK